MDYAKAGSQSPTIGYSSSSSSSGVFLSPSQSMSGLFGAGGGSILTTPSSPATAGGSPALHATGTGTLSLLQVRDCDLLML